ncbi:MAG: hypothetical protein KGJ13_11920 [Patescibacteria group bacterium]|nr:hypothetical protein [Patescibacteria group bacterium]
MNNNLPDIIINAPHELVGVPKLLDEFFATIERDGLVIERLAKRAGHNFQPIYNWRSGKFAPRLSVFCDFLGAAGYELKIVRRGE